MSSNSWYLLMIFSIKTRERQKKIISAQSMNQIIFPIIPGKRQGKICPCRRSAPVQQAFQPPGHGQQPPVMRPWREKEEERYGQTCKHGISRGCRSPSFNYRLTYVNLEPARHTRACPEWYLLPGRVSWMIRRWSREYATKSQASTGQASPD